MENTMRGLLKLPTDLSIGDIVVTPQGKTMCITQIEPNALTVRLYGTGVQGEGMSLNALQDVLVLTLLPIEKEPMWLRLLPTVMTMVFVFVVVYVYLVYFAR